MQAAGRAGAREGKRRLTSSSPTRSTGSSPTRRSTRSSCPAALELLFRGQVPEGVDPATLMQVEPIHPEYQDREAPPAR